ncbi:MULTISPECIES: UvrY/SirA/GacA family response regulator transcription factor [Alteromonadaceae]|uniref:UvrY/SirA/GacA family response regulator transcription factor n=1 Tax=Brumicola blandensis TaxID=3075611 RepID=A0AAW8R0Q9_9ALTE|nr:MULTISPECIES: UvrY/SirA/GacA family response regulator transcription factor [unclassified Alteromonas]MDT0581430.1 UvrY/SirA/GacA family response regulator transcription factor [Alteromonas sp. W409]MDT0627058.1 UvrY/SirA/GacA family response regulator transcription factor [Alteromonas sp. W364]
MIKILLVDDHELVRTGISRILNDVNDFEVVAAVGSGEDAVDHCRKAAPDIIMMDVSMPGIGGLEATRKILRFCEDTKVICLSMHKENPIPTKIMQAGAHGFLTKDAEPAEMVNAIYKVSAGQRYISAEVAQELAIGVTNPNNDNPFASLSDRELEITLMLTRGTRVPEIATNLNISAKTVNTYRYRMFDKLGVQSDVELTHLALRHKLIQTEV